MPLLALTMGDPAGIGPEIILKALALRVASSDYKVVVFASRTLLEDAYIHLRSTGQVPLADPAEIEIVDVVGDRFIPGVPSAASGELSFAYLRTAIEWTLAGHTQALVTAPISKTAWHLAGHRYPGQTEVLAQMSKADRYGMLFVARSPHTGWFLRVLLATTHIPLREVPVVLGPQLIEAKLELLTDCLRSDFGVAQPSIAVAGLNPHSGEGGQLGREECDWLSPLLEGWHGRGVSGPVPPDTLWVAPGRAWYGRGTTPFDAYLALYHDQGLIPVKLLAFDQAVNTTIGLSIVRTSPDHGTAYDIAGRGVARPDSLLAALELAAQIANRRVSQPNRPATTA
ncbi:MAG: 4-hydroxythreonine-4-phosphate dehydrogenase PdxA [Gemmatimonadaceae bacterium]|nr:4-hydroxythreonine-4-phosphate dehydrogenase PdxA [Gloeobacterales cyanobacterium ES-bin-141]